VHHRLADMCINSYSNCSTWCKKILKIGSVVFELNSGRKWKLCCDLAEICFRFEFDSNVVILILAR